MDDLTRLPLDLATAWNRLEQSLDAALSSSQGIRFADYRILRALRDAPGDRRTRVDLAGDVGLSPSGVTRALRPLEKIGVVRSEPSERDARLALAGLTAAGRRVEQDARSLVQEQVEHLLGGLRRTPGPAELVRRLLA